MKRTTLSLLAIGIAAFTLAVGLAAEEHQATFEKTLALSPQGGFKLSNVNGDVTISTWKQAKVEIKAVKKTRKAEENLGKVSIEVRESAGVVSVETVYPKHDDSGVSVDYAVRVPEGVRLEDVKTVNGRIGLTGPYTMAAATTVNGKVRVENASGDLKFETTNGDVEAVNVAGRLSAETTNGGIDITLTGLKDDLRAETVNGGITIRWAAGSEPNGRLEAETTNGGIELGFPITVQGVLKKHHIQGTMGGGGPLLSLETVNGSISLTK